MAKITFLDASSHLYMRVCPSVRRSVGRSVGRSVRGSRFRQKRENRRFCLQIMMSHVISSSYNHFIITRTHRWPYGPCFGVDPLHITMTKIENRNFALFFSGKHPFNTLPKINLSDIVILIVTVNFHQYLA